MLTAGAHKVATNRAVPTLNSTLSLASIKATAACLVPLHVFAFLAINVVSRSKPVGINAPDFAEKHALKATVTLVVRSPKQELTSLR